MSDMLYDLLRESYVFGELSLPEFEAKVEQALRGETVVLPPSARLVVRLRDTWGRSLVGGYLR